ncbi:hypothetical protein H6P81_013306 [Aristolochia fimbriata]|uniref:Uncharacterized protein n=1 Tax=Aristolochia fimbriata TaxID=158543 RepID=A0AAV7EEL5_ARIFI|nr:hypothetical protein H6P81_013306 [Aristolochia fimbriata]
MRSFMRVFGQGFARRYYCILIFLRLLVTCYTPYSISPLSMGILSGKYFSPDGAPPDGRMNGFRGKYSEGESKYNLSNATVQAATKDQHRDELPSRDKAEKEKVEPLDGLPSETALDSGSTNKTRYELLIELEAALMDKSNHLLKQMNCAHLENFLHEAREEAHTNLCAADRRASEYSALRTSAVKTGGLFERLRACVTAPGGVAGFANSLRALALSLASSANENEDDATADIRACMRLLAEKVSFLFRQREELLERCSRAEAAQTHLTKELEEKKELVKSLYDKHRLEKQRPFLSVFSIRCVGIKLEKMILWRRATQAFSVEVTAVSCRSRPRATLVAPTEVTIIALCKKRKAVSSAIYRRPSRNSDPA